MALPTFGTLHYNGYTFNEKTETVALSMRPVYDHAGRTVLYLLFSITVRTVITGVAGTDAEVGRIRRQLTRPAGRLNYDGRGFGGLLVNVGAGPKDVVWGPRPQELSWKPLGRNLAGELTWRVDVALPDCDNAAYQFRPLEFSFSVTHDVDKGYTRRTIAGYLRIPQTRRGATDRRLSDSPDYYRERIAPPLLPGFRRSYGPWTVNEAKDRLDWSIVDDELRGAVPPPGVVEASLSHEVSTTTAGLTLWTGTIAGEYELAKFANPLLAVRYFMAVCKERIFNTARAVGKNASGIIPVAFKMTEPDAYAENRAKFMLGYTFVQPVKDILRAASLWRPVPGSDWRLWALSLQNTAFGPRGYAHLEFAAEDDRIIDLCDPSPYIGTLGAGHGGIGSLPRPGVAVPIPAVPALPDIQEGILRNFPTPAPASSWIYYESELWLETDQANTPIRPLPIRKASEALLRAGTGLVPGQKQSFWDVLADATMPIAGFINDLKGGKAVLAGVTTPNDLANGTHHRGAPVCYVYLRGRAARAGFPVPIPLIRDVAGVKPVPACRLDRGEGFGQGVYKGVGVPLYTGSWNLRYYLPEVPRHLPVPPNPILRAQ
jgi:hypothetical protein